MGHGALKGGLNAPRSTFYDEGKFGRLFPALPPFASDTATVRDALMEIGAPEGPMDPRDDLSDPVRLVTEAEESVNNPDNPRLAAGFTFLGQFLDHDMTFDPTSSLARRQDPESIRNFRIPVLDLDSVYGSGPGNAPHLYDQLVDEGRTTMLIEEIPASAARSIDGSSRYDHPRNWQCVSLIGDPRNDENLIVSQLHLAMLRFHNKVVADVRADLGAGADADDVFAEAQRIVRWHYQWIVLHEFLPATVGTAVVEDVLNNGRRYYRWRNSPYIPVEFAVAAYRFGHSQVRPSYRANFGTDATDPAKQFFPLIFKPGPHPDPADPDDLRGGVRAARRFIDWQTFFDFGDGRSRRNKKIDTKLSTVLFDLLGQPQGTPTSLATRNLLRGLTMGVPSGQRVASAMGLTRLATADLQDMQEYGLHHRTPLWFYILREADVQTNGEHLGAVGGRIVTEVLVGLMEGDNHSYLRQDPDWTPTYGTNDDFRITDLLSAAGVVAEIP
ncbi:heme peroxidase family protein [Actinomycetospora rhizophila]|uniref:Heme peroxidase family protein n=1 Tax=Actinomycetospora rhizophila TaxID=1416876 RepID=A0ABV9ZLA5_9PSEU